MLRSTTLIGLEAILADPSCERVELVGPGGERVVRIREGGDVWADEAGRLPSLHARDLIPDLERSLAEGFDRLICVLAAEEIVYSVRRGSVAVERRPRAQSPDALLEAIRPVAEALGIPATRRKAKLTQAIRFATIVAEGLGQGSGTVRLLDLACGRSYVGFVLAAILKAQGREIRLHGVDANEALIETSQRIAEELGWDWATFEAADLASYRVERGGYDVAVALHACDTLTDEAIRIAHEAGISALYLAPCCQHELRHAWGKHPLRWVARYGLLEQRLADVLTDAFRCLVLEALGYRVRTHRFADPEITPKNLLIEARATGRPDRAKAAQARAFLSQFDTTLRLAVLIPEI